MSGLICPECGEVSVIEVARQDNMIFYSCHTEDCVNYAKMLVDVGVTEDEHVFIAFDDMFNGMKQVLQDTDNTEEHF